MSHSHNKLATLPTMEFEDRLRRAIERGEKTRDERGREEIAKELSIEELRTLYTQYRFAVSEHIETSLRKLVDHLPGFKYQTIMSEDGWGARLTRDDLHLVAGRPPESRYSRLEVLITPFSPSGIVEVVIKGAIRNRELMTRKHFQKIQEFDLEAFLDLIDLRIVEFAEAYSSSSN